jgi:hypothetical protein
MNFQRIAPVNVDCAATMGESFNNRGHLEAAP